MFYLILVWAHQWLLCEMLLRSERLSEAAVALASQLARACVMPVLTGLAVVVVAGLLIGWMILFVFAREQEPRRGLH